jgi:hypothetical protein
LIWVIRKYIVLHDAQFDQELSYIDGISCNPVARLCKEKDLFLYRVENHSTSTRLATPISQRSLKDYVKTFWQFAHNCAQQESYRLNLLHMCKKSSFHYLEMHQVKRICKYLLCDICILLNHCRQITKSFIIY